MSVSGRPLDGVSLGAQVANHTFTVLETDAVSSLSAFRKDRPMVLDFWHAKCVNCPAALTKLDRLAASGKYPGVVFAACAISLGTEATDQEHISEMIEGEWEELVHLYATVREKEIAKAEYGFSTVPFCVVFAADGEVLSMGDPARLNFDDLLTVLTKQVPVDDRQPMKDANRELPSLGALDLDADF
eukprot:CAMPEP_0183349606 /NCGR_PEP_ID=MMETSP0164_2-20130417/13734_1 /TAXON_ID=221442 /ORGANISM="Coccolithus pelagicus ssp braarudi, Strain PLY182g" /LENGTH=186 /DNA_ID=CAMNT_0025521353 /DNA_START=27 /DNA_END=587 /DNA_ORIENTATION=+